MRKLKRSAFGTLLLGGLLTACTDTATPTPTPTAINGTISGWAAGSGTVTLQEGSAVLGSGTLNSNGTFQLALPAANTVAPYLTTMGNFTSEESGCGGTVTVSDQNAQAYAVTALTATAGGSSQTILPETYSATSTAAQATLTIDSRIWIYADRNVNLSGNVTCSGTSEGVTVDVKLTANARLHTGWNVLKSSTVVTANAQGTQGSLTTSLENTTDTAFTWTSQSQAAPLSVTKSSSRQGALLSQLENMRPFQK